MATAKRPLEKAALVAGIYQNLSDLLFFRYPWYYVTFTLYWGRLDFTIFPVNISYRNSASRKIKYWDWLSTCKKVWKVFKKLDLNIDCLYLNITTIPFSSQIVNKPNKLKCCITSDWKGMPLTNTLAYWTCSKVTKRRCCEYNCRESFWKMSEWSCLMHSYYSSMMFLGLNQVYYWGFKCNTHNN